MRITKRLRWAAALAAMAAPTGWGEPLTARAFMEGEGATLERMSCSVGIVEKGAPVFMDRSFAFHEPPDGVRGMTFLRTLIDGGKAVAVAKEGVLTVITPAPDIPGVTCSNSAALEELGFVWIQAPAVFQLFGESRVDQCRIYQKRVKAGERFTFKKWAVVAGFNPEGLDLYRPNARVARVVDMLKQDTSHPDAQLNAQDIVVNRPDYVVFIPRQPRDKEKRDPAKPGDTYNDHFQMIEHEGTFYAFWTQASREADIDQHIAFSKSVDNGETWSEPVILAGSPNKKNPALLASWQQPMISKSGRIYCLWNQQVTSRGPHCGNMFGAYSDDKGETWSAPKMVPMKRSMLDDPDPLVPPSWCNWQRPLRLGKDGRFLVGVSRHSKPPEGKGVCTIEFLQFDNIDDDPKVEDIRLSWFSGDENVLRVNHEKFGSAAEEVGLVKLPDGRLFGIMRTSAGYPFWTQSRDDGVTWTQPKPLLDRDGGTPYLHPRSPCPIYDWRGPEAASGLYFALVHNTFDFDGEREYQKRGPLYLIAGRFNPDAEQPVEFAPPKLFAERENGNSFYTSYTVAGGQGVLWFPDPKFYLLGRVIGEEWFEGLVPQPLEGPRATVALYGDGASDTFAPGARLFTDREYTVKECPEWLRGKTFLRGSIESSFLRVTRDGVLTFLTPEPGHPRASTQVKALERLGFTWIPQPERFQLFGAQPFDLARVYQKRVKKGDRLRLGKWAVALDFEAAEVIPATPQPWNANTGERLYNGIVLPEEWPPQTISPRDTAPMDVPYLTWRPPVVPIDVGRQLFVDDFLVETSSLRRVFHMPKKYAGNPILKPETPLELNGDKNSAAVPKSGGVWWDPAEKVFKMWYEAGWIGTICYATSKDGLAWERPALDVVPGTNQVLPPDLTPDSWTVVPDWQAADPMQRYKMYMRPPGGQMPGVSMTSPDGIHWTNRVFSGDTGDRSTMFYNPFRKKWVYSLRSGFRGRSRHYLECDDFLAGARWEPDGPVVWAAADRDDPPDPEVGRTCQLYNLDAVAYESLMLGIYQIHRGPENNVCESLGLPKITELNFAYSRDGFHWHRPDRRAHIPAERRDVWDRAYVQSIGNICTIQGDTLWIYYTGFQGDASKTNRNWLKNGMYDRGATGVAFLRRDGFASMEAGAEDGTLTTRPVTFSGKHLFVNASGTLSVEILDAETLRVLRPPSTAGTVDSTCRHVLDVSAFSGKPVRFRFTLRNGALYAFWVSRDTTGRSDGYVAGGGPGYTGPTDTVGRDALGKTK